MNRLRLAGTKVDPRRTRLAGIAEMARGLVGPDFGFVATADGALHIAAGPPKGGGPSVDLHRLEQLLRLVDVADEVVVVEDTAADPAWAALAAAGTGAGPVIGSFSVVRLRSAGNDAVGLAGGGGVAGGPAPAGVIEALRKIAAVATDAVESGDGDDAADAELPEQRRRPREPDGTILDSLRDAVMMFDGTGRVLTSNSALGRLFEVPADWLKGRTHEEMIALLERAGGGVCDADGAPFPIERHPVVVSRETGEPVSNVLMGIRRSRACRTEWFHVSARPHVRAHSVPPYPVVVSFSDVTDVRAAELERDELLATIVRERMFLAAVLASVGEGIEACDVLGRVTVFNDAMWLFFQPAPGEDPFDAPPSVTGLARPDGRPLAPAEHPLLLALADARVNNVELVMTTTGGTVRRLLVNGHQLRSPTGETLGAVVAFHDVTEQKRVETQLTELALHDPLTGLANRILLSDRLEVAFERGVREGTSVGVLWLDLDDFKGVNDTYGHAVGDEVLVAVANRLRAVVRPGDTVARLGGDEFVVVCPLAGGEPELDRVRERLATVLAEPVRAGDVEIAAAASIGVALSGPGKSDPERLLRKADESMYRVKEARRNGAAGTG